MLPESEGRPIYLQIAYTIAADILAGTFAEEEQVPSTNELAVHYRINPATAGKALNRLVDEGVLYKRRGLGMFVVSGAPDVLRRRRLAEFSDAGVAAFVNEGLRLGLGPAEIEALVSKALKGTWA